MKNLILFLLIITMNCHFSFSQSSVTKTFKVSKENTLDMELSYANNIDIRTWDKDEVLIEAKIKLSNQNTDKGYDLDFERKNSVFKVKSHLDYDQLPSVVIEPDEDGVLDVPDNFALIGQKDGVWQAVNYEIKYTIKMPAYLAIDLCTKGDVEIKGLDAAMNINTTKGFIDVTRNADDPIDLKLSTGRGEIFTDFDIDYDASVQDKKKHHRSCIKTEVKTALNGGGDDVNLSSTCGNIYLRKAS